MIVEKLAKIAKYPEVLEMVSSSYSHLFSAGGEQELCCILKLSVD